MAKRKDRGKKRSTRSRRGSAQTPDEIMQHLTSIWVRAMGTPREGAEAKRRFFGISIGTLIAAKLYLRLVSDGELKFTGDPVVLDKLELLSDQEADKLLSQMKDLDPAAEFLPVLLHRSERTYLHLVRDRTDYRWCKESISPNDPVPVPIEDLEGTQPIADRVMFEMMEYLGKARAAVIHDERESTNEFLSQLVAIMALSKVILAAHGNGKVAAFVEGLAEIVSAAEYKDMARSRALD